MNGTYQKNFKSSFHKRKYSIWFDIRFVFFISLEESEEDIKNGRVISIEESKERLRKKYANFNVK